LEELTCLDIPTIHGTKVWFGITRVFLDRVKVGFQSSNPYGYGEELYLAKVELRDEQRKICKID
jgi:hypothetical protein